MSALGAEDIAAIYPKLSSDWKTIIVDAVRDAPTSGAEWSEFFIVESYCGPAKSAKEFRAEMNAKVAQYRAGVEAARNYLIGTT